MDFDKCDSITIYDHHPRYDFVISIQCKNATLSKNPIVAVQTVLYAKETIQQTYFDDTEN